MIEAVGSLWFLWFVFFFLPWFFIWRHFNYKDSEETFIESSPTKASPDDYWDGEDIDYDTGEIGADTRASVRHPKNRDRAYSGSVERFHDGGW